MSQVELSGEREASASTPSAELRDEHAKGLVALLAFEKWWRLPNVERTIGAIEPAMRLCLEVLGDTARLPERSET